MPESPATLVERVLETLLLEEKELAALVVLAVEEQTALVASDFPEMTRLGELMLVRAEAMTVLEQRRESLLRDLGVADATLDTLLPLADDLGITGFAEARLRLVAKAAELRDNQERNARLLLSAMKLHEKWVNMFAAIASSTYGADGQQAMRAGRQFVSKSA
ncbi:MAG TPA: flagellar export chaperone FlgN [Tepidiformaceae bacterium]|jgi:flagellar biosynthesis/type III secretory pathway chaperone|nr:flagellar export chaperone FlgN [Tepidiformaceae bacterium]